MPRVRRTIEEELRRRIRSGTYAPGTRIPTQRALLRELRTSSGTLHRAVERLSEQGYLVTRGTRGTYVGTRLPHRSRIAVVIPDVPTDVGWNRFWSTLRTVADGWRESAREFRTYCIPGHRTDSDVHRALCTDVADGGLSGLVFVTPPHYLGDSPVLRAGLPRVILDSDDPRDVDRYRATVVSVAIDEFREALMAHLVARGRRRLAALTGHSTDLLEEYLPAMRAHRIETRPEWWLPVPLDPLLAACVATVTRLLMSLPERQRPDALLISDDNLVPAATAALRDLGVAVPDDLTVVAHANFPNPIAAAVPCTRYGVDTKQLLACARDEIERLIGGAAPRRVTVPHRLRA